jgi:hypothetical protein
MATLSWLDCQLTVSINFSQYSMPLLDLRFVFEEVTTSLMLWPYFTGFGCQNELTSSWGYWRIVHFKVSRLHTFTRSVVWLTYQIVVNFDLRRQCGWKFQPIF